MSVTSSGEKTRLSGSLGPIAIIFMVVAAAAPLTTVGATVPIAILLGNGPSFPIMYVVSACILALFAVGFMAMAPYVRSAGAFYSYVSHALGNRWGIGAAFLALVTYSTVQVAVHAFMGAVLNGLAVDHGLPDIGWWFWSMVSVGVVGVLGYRHIDLSSKVLGIILVAEIALCAAIVVGVVFQGGPEGFSTAALNPSKMLDGSPGLGLMFAISGFIGFEATAIYRDEARNPNRTVPRATYGALALIGVFYAVVGWAMVTAWGDEGAVARAETHSETMLPDTAQRVLGGFAGDLVQWVLVGSIFACVLSFHNVLARYFFALGNSGALPAQLGRKHVVHGSPQMGSLTQTASAAFILIVCAVLQLDPVAEVFAWLVGVATVGVLVLMVFTSVAVIIYFSRNDAEGTVWKRRIAPVLGLLGLSGALLITLWNGPLLFGSGKVAIVAGAVIIAAFVLGYARGKVHPEADVEAIELT